MAWQIQSSDAESMEWEMFSLKSPRVNEPGFSGVELIRESGRVGFGCCCCDIKLSHSRMYVLCIAYSQTSDSIRDTGSIVHNMFNLIFGFSMKRETGD